MISGPDLRRLLLALALLAAPAPAWAQAVWGLPQLMHSLAQTRSATARFTQRQTSPVLSAPLISSGTLDYVAPDYLRKTTVTPAPESFTLDHGEVTLSGANTGGTHVFALDQDPRIAALVEGIRASLAGDLPALQQFYQVSLSGDAAAWQLHLRPGGPSLARFIRAITISGTEGRITQIDTLTTDGGETEMTIDDAQAADAP